MRVALLLDWITEGNGYLIIAKHAPKPKIKKEMWKTDVNMGGESLSAVCGVLFICGLGGVLRWLR